MVVGRSKGQRWSGGGGKQSGFRAPPPNSRQTSRISIGERAVLLFVWNDSNSFTFDISIVKLSPLLQFLMCSLRNACCIK